MTRDLIDGFDSDALCSFLNAKFSGSLSRAQASLPEGKEFGWKDAARLGVVKTVPGPNGANRPLLVVSARLPDGQELKERSSRIRQFKFAKKVLDAAMANPAPGVEGLLSQGIFVFHDQHGNFRLSLVYGQAEGTRLRWSTAKRLSFHVQAGHPNKTFRSRSDLPWNTFDKLQDAFSVEKLTKEFYNRLFAWYEAAMKSDEVVFPNDLVKDKEPGQVKSEQIIRLITRLMFVWFLKQKHLVPDELFDPARLKTILRDFHPGKGDNYYRAILQNLFFATLNSDISDREFAVEGSRAENEEHFGVKILYRYAADFVLSEQHILKLFSTIPFLNGGLFECLDRDNLYFDGFSRRKGKQARVPNRLLFDEAAGLIPLLEQYNFTVEENSPGDEEVALDPELLGKVFENLLAAYNPETNETARNATGSFYTPREIVNYMVDESLIAMLTTQCGDEHEKVIRALFAEGTRPDDGRLREQVDKALLKAKILDPACGSGAFPMGVLLRMVDILRVLRDLPEDKSVYDLKLELIENCIYGADIQCIAVQIAKLRFFISLVCEQKPTDDPKRNFGINTLPNLETKFVAADSLIGLTKPEKRTAHGKLQMQADMFSEEEDPDIKRQKAALWRVRHEHFLARSYPEKKELRAKDKRLRDQLTETLRSKEGYSTDAAKRMAAWDPYDQNKSSPFCDPEWMFNVRAGFDVVIGNPPYVQVCKGKYDKDKFIYSEGKDTGKQNLYKLFIEHAYHEIKSRGCFCMIVQSSLMCDQSATHTRELLLKNMTLYSVLEFPKVAPTREGQVFENVLQGTCIVLCERSIPKAGHVFSISSNNDVTTISSMQAELVLQSSLLEFYPDSYCIPLVRPHDFQLMKKINTGSTRLGSVIGAISQGDLNLTTCKNYISSNKTPVKLLRGRNISRYGVNYEVSEWVSANFRRDRVELNSSKPCLVCQEVTGTVDARRLHFAETVPGKYLFGHTANKLCIDDKVSRKIILGILNSKLMDWYFRKTSTNNHVGGYEIVQLPIKMIKDASASEMYRLINEIHVAKINNLLTDTSELENKIDDLVYKIYGLTREEIAIVEKSTNHSRGRESTIPLSTGSEMTNTDTVNGRLRLRIKKKNSLPPSLSGWD